MTEIDFDLAALLQPGETVLWWGRPHYPHFRSEAWAAFVFGLIALGAASVGAVISVIVFWGSIANGQFDKLLGLPIALIPTGGFGYIAFQCLATPWRVPRALARAGYVVTDRRVIIRCAPGYARSATVPTLENDFYVFTPDQARTRRMCKRSSQRVDLVLGSESQGSGRYRMTVDVGVIGAKDWEGAEAAMASAAFRSREAPPTSPR